MRKICQDVAPEYLLQMLNANAKEEKRSLNMLASHSWPSGYILVPSHTFSASNSILTQLP
jgi:hypothetical protein